MQSHLEGPKRQRRPAAPRRKVWYACVVCRSACEEFVLLGPVERQIEFAQTRRSERDGLPALQDRVDEPRAHEGEIDEAPDVTPADAVALGQLFERSDTPGGQLLKPPAPTHDRLDQRRITSRGLILLRQPRQHHFGCDTPPLKVDGGGQLDCAGAGSSDARDGTSPLDRTPYRTFMTMRLSSTMTCSTSSRTN